MRSQDWLISGLELKSCPGYAGTTHVTRQNMQGIRTADALTGSRNPSMVPLKMRRSGPSASPQKIRLCQSEAWRLPNPDAEAFRRVPAD